MSGRNRLGSSAAGAAVLAWVAIMLWVVGVGTSWHSTCPGPIGLSTEGRDKPVSMWPPGARCVSIPHGGPPAAGEPRLDGIRHRTYVYEAAPILKWLIAGLGASAALVLVTGLAIEIRATRSRDRTRRGIALRRSSGPPIAE